MKTLLLAFGLTLLFGCTKSENKNAGEPGPSCPLAIVSDQQEFVLAFQTTGVPENVLVRYNGIVKYNSCTQQADSNAPVVRVESENGTDLKIQVLHFRAFAVLPEEASLEVVDLKSCRNDSQIAFHDEHLPLDFKSKVVGPTACNLKENVSESRIPVN